METRHGKQKALEAARSRLRPRPTADDNKPATDKSNTKPKPSRTKAGPQSKTAPRAKVGPRSKVPARPEQTDPNKADVAQPQLRRSNRLLQTDATESEGAPEDMAVDKPGAVSKVRTHYLFPKPCAHRPRVYPRRCSVALEDQHMLADSPGHHRFLFVSTMWRFLLSLLR